MFVHVYFRWLAWSISFQKAVVPGDLSIVDGRLFSCPGSFRWAHVDRMQAKLLSVALAPFKVVEKRPGLIYSTEIYSQKCLQTMQSSHEHWHHPAGPISASESEKWDWSKTEVYLVYVVLVVVDPLQVIQVALPVAHSILRMTFICKDFFKVTSWLLQWCRGPVLHNDLWPRWEGIEDPKESPELHW